MAKKNEAPQAADLPKPVIAVEYGGKLYPSFQTAEGARAKSDLMDILADPVSCDRLDMYASFVRSGQHEAIDRVIKNAERVHGILSRYLDAAKVALPRNDQ